MEGNTHKYVAEEGSRDLFCRRAPHGARGLKHGGDPEAICHRRRAPHGARGLKPLSARRQRILTRVAPRMGRVD